MDSDSFVNVCIQQIGDTYYYYGYLGDFKIIIDSRNGFVNATKLCASGSKKFFHWLEMKHAKSFIDYIKCYYSSKNGENCEVLYEYRGKRSETAAILRGTYVHEDLIIPIACWVSNLFAHKVVKIIKHVNVKYVREKYMKEISTLETTVMVLENETKKYKQVEEDISPKSKDKSKQNTFVLTEIDGKYPLHATRCQRRSMILQLQRLRKTYPYAKVLYKRDYDPNAVNLFNRTKEKIPYIKTSRNKIKLYNNYSVDEFIKDIEKIADTKM